MSWVELDVVILINIEMYSYGCLIVFIYIYGLGSVVLNDTFRIVD